MLLTLTAEGAAVGKPPHWPQVFPPEMINSKLMIVGSLWSISPGGL